MGDGGDLGVGFNLREVGGVWGSSLGGLVEDERAEDEFFMKKSGRVCAR